MMVPEDKARVLDVEDEISPSQADPSVGTDAADLDDATYDVLQPGEKLLKAQFRVER